MIEHRCLTDDEKTALAHKVIEDSLPSELHEPFIHVMQRAFSSRKNCDYRVELDPETIRRCTVLLKPYISYDSDFSMTRARIIAICKTFGFRDSEQIFINSLPKVQMRWLRSLPIGDHVAMYAHLRMSKEIGVTSTRRLEILDFVRMGAKMQVNAFIRNVEKDSIALGVNQGLDFTVPGDEFMHTLEYSRTAFRTFGSLKQEMQTFLRIAYGTEVYLEVTERLLNELWDISTENVMDLFDNWSKWRTFPSEWIREMLNTDSSHDDLE